MDHPQPACNFRHIHHPPGVGPVADGDFQDARPEALQRLRDTREAMALLDAVQLPGYGDDRAAAPRDVPFSWCEERFLTAPGRAPDIAALDAD